MNIQLSVCAAVVAACVAGHVHAAQVAPAAIKVSGMTFTATALPGNSGVASIVPTFATPYPDEIAVAERGTTPSGQEWRRFTEYTTIDSDVSVTLPSGQASIARQGTDIEATSHLDTSYIGLRSGSDGAWAATFRPLKYDYTLSPRSSFSVTAQYSFLVPGSVEALGFDQLPANIQALASTPNGFVELESRAYATLDLTVYPNSYENNFTPYTASKSMTAWGTGRLSAQGLTFTPRNNFNGFYAEDGEVFTTLTPTEDGMYNLTAQVTMTINNYRNEAVRVVLSNDMAAASYFEASGTVPEPATWAFMGLGLVGVAGVASRRRKAACQAA